MGGTIAALANPVSTTYSNVTGDKDSNLAKNIGIQDRIFHPLEGITSDMVNAQAPGAPGADSDAESVLKKQQDLAKNFRTNLPNMQSQLNAQMAQKGAQSLKGDLRDIRSADSRRGLLYGGVNAGNEGQARLQNSQAMAQGRSDINAATQQMASGFDQQAVASGLMARQNQADIQDLIYSQAMATMNAEGQTFSGLMSGGGKIGGMMMAGA